MEEEGEEIEGDTGRERQEVRGGMEENEKEKESERKGWEMQKPREAMFCTSSRFSR